ncbi:hypothetical protein BASA81_007988 [Batrachochytrium salamandrivorans]|nr:hypothetical protein BASA81_007988 [Batrachochytrium salamandrivorans]
MNQEEPLLQAPNVANAQAPNPANAQAQGAANTQAQGARAQALQQEITTLRGKITAASDEIAAFGKEIRTLGTSITNLLISGGQQALVDELKEREPGLKDQQNEAKAQQAELKDLLKLAQDELAGTMRGGEPPLKRLQLANDSAVGNPGFVYRVLVKHPLDFSEQGVIQLGTSLWGIPGKHEFLFNRNFQVGVDLARAFVQKRESVIVAGSKGIGKSCLGLVIVDTLVKDGQIVAYESGNTQMLLVPSKAALTRFTTAASFVRQDDGALFRDLCLCTDLVHVVDLGELYTEVVESSFPKIVISSPHADKLKRFGEIQLGANYIIYPVWTLEELKKMNSELVGDKKQADDVLKTKYELFGGIPRQIFLGETVEQAMERLTAAVNQVTIETWKAAFFASSYTTITRQVPGLFVRITASTAPGRQCNVEFASDCIMQLAIRHHARTNRAELVGFLNAFEQPPSNDERAAGLLVGRSDACSVVEPNRSSTSCWISPTKLPQ